MVAVKATFTIKANSSLDLDDEQRPVLLTPSYFGEPGRSSLRYDAELGPLKPTTDVTVLGNAHSPSGKLTDCVPVSLRVGAIHKSILVFGDRKYKKGVFSLNIDSPVPFVQKPIRYEDAYGGSVMENRAWKKPAFESRNPVGCGVCTADSELDGKKAPSIVYRGDDSGQSGPAGLGPIDRHWSPRLSYAGSYDETWQRTKSPLLPDDYDARFELCAPPDQQPAQYLRGGELLVLEHMTPQRLLQLSLPKIFLTFTTMFGSQREEHRSRLTSVIVEPGEVRLTMIWQTMLRVPARRVELLDETVIREKAYLS